MTLHLTKEQTAWIFQNSDPLGEPERKRPDIPISNAPLDYRRAAFFDFTGEEFYNAALSLIDFLAESDGPIPSADSLACDLYTYGELEFGLEAFRTLRMLNEVYETEAETEAHFKTFDRLATPDDRPLIDVMSEAEQSGWQPPSKVSKALNWIRGEASRAFHLKKSQQRLAEEDRARIAELVRQGFVLGPFGYQKPEELTVSDVIPLRSVSPTSPSARLQPRRTSAATFAGKPVPEREWIVPGFIPARNVTLLYGDGGVGKSLLALQLGVVVAVVETGRTWFGRPVKHGPVEYVTAEDSLDELHIRLADVTRETGVSLSDLGALNLTSLSDECALLAELTAGGALVESALYQELDQVLRASRPALLIIDTLADVFPGNEVVRAQVRAFVAMLRRLALAHGCAIVVLAHPSLAGMEKGTSGSTGWSNSVRSRLYFDHMRDTDGSVLDADARVLRVMKSNYAQTGTEIRMRWRAGAFVPEMAMGGDPLTAQFKAERVFLNLLEKCNARGQAVSLAAGANYAPKVFEDEARKEGVPKKSLKAAMERLLDAKRIELIPHGAPSRGAKRLWICS